MTQSRKSEPIRKGYADTPEGQVHYLESGTGYPVLFLHMTADAATQWESVLPIMAGLGYRAIAMDIPGHGNSYRPSSEPDGPTYARAIQSALDALRITRVTVVGHHFGAVVGAWTTVLAPNLVERFGAYGWPRHSAEVQAQRRAKEARTFDREGDVVKDVWTRRWKMSGDRLASGEQSRFTEALAIRTMIAKLQAGKNWNWAYHCIGNTDPVVLAGKISCPVLTFAGPRDDNYSESKIAVPDFANARFVPMEWVGVDAPDEEPAHIARIVHEFICDTPKT